MTFDEYLSEALNLTGKEAAAIRQLRPHLAALLDDDCRAGLRALCIQHSEALRRIGRQQDNPLEREFIFGQAEQVRGVPQLLQLLEVNVDRVWVEFRRKVKEADNAIA